MKYIIDRFESSFAVVELDDKSLVNIPRCALPTDCREGDVISVSIDKDETSARQRRIEELAETLWND